jgi:hypothetical protein
MESLMLSNGYLSLYATANLVALALVALAHRRPDLARWFFVTLFLGAGVLNGLLLRLDPRVYVDGYGPLALLTPYRLFIGGVFARHTQPIVLAIALGQLAVGALLAGRRRLLQLGALGGGVFLLAIAPLGTGSTFPAPLLLLAALLVTVLRLTQQVTPAPGAHDTPGTKQRHAATRPSVRQPGAR